MCGAVPAPGCPPDALSGLAFSHAISSRKLVAVLSPSNTPKEIDLKLRRYREAHDNLYAVVIEPRELLVTIHARRRNWQPVPLTEADDLIHMPEFGLRCIVADVYSGTPPNPQRG